MKTGPKRPITQKRPHYRAALFALFVAILAGGRLARAEEAPAARVPEREAPSPKPRDSSEGAQAMAGKAGFSIDSGDGRFKLRIRGYVQADARFYGNDDAESFVDTFLIRRARPYVEGTLFKYFEFRIQPDFGSGRAELSDAYAVARVAGNYLRIRTGKFKAPIGLERLQSSTNLVFVERGLPTDLVPNRDIGLQIEGEAFDEGLTWAFGIFNGVPNGTSRDLDLDDNKDLAGRLFVRLPKGVGIAASAGLGIGVAGSWGKQAGSLEDANLAPLRTIGQQVFFRYLAGDTLAETTVAAGALSRLAPQLYYHFGPFGVLGEFTVIWQTVQIGTSRSRLRQWAWQVAPMLVLYGGDASYDGLKPKHPVGGAGIGSLYIAARYNQLHIESDAFPTFADPDKSASTARAWGVGLGWNANVAYRILATFDRTTFDGGASGGGDRAPENFLAGRFQVAF